MFDLDQFNERAAIMEFDGGLTRFAAETAAAAAQGLSRWQAMEAQKHANSIGHSGAARDHRPADAGHAAHHMPGVQRGAEEQKGSVSERVVPAGRGGVDVLALQLEGRGLL